jgi:tetratricopeptide (TPR) repeat protein
LRAGIQFELASYLGSTGVSEPGFTEAAISEWRRVLQFYSRSSNPRRWAISCLELAQCYAHRREANHDANVRESLRLLDASLEVLTSDKFPEDFALAQSRKGSLLLDMGSEPNLVERSLAAFQEALSVYKKESYPQDWAVTLSNMSTAYLSRSASDSNDLRKGVALMEQTLTVRSPQADPYSWAITQMNLGLALSRLPAGDADEPHERALRSLRAAYEVFRELGERSLQFTAAYNLGVTLAHFGDPTLAGEGCDHLEESLPWLIETNQSAEAAQAIDLLSQGYLKWLENEPDPAKGDQICQRALDTFKEHAHTQSAMKANYEIGLWLLRHSENHPDRLALAGLAFEHLLASLPATEQLDSRAAALGNLATVLLLQRTGSLELNRVRARKCMDEALRILRSLPATPERERAIGLILTNQIRSGFATP